MNNNELLRPTLSDSPLLQPIYSVGALIAAAVFGGMLSVCIVAGENVRRQRRLGKDAIWLALAVVLSLALLFGVIRYQLDSGGELDMRAARLANRAGGFALAGLFYWLHRTAYRTQRFTGADAPSPYGIVAIATVISIGVIFALLPVLQKFVETGSQ